MYIIGFNGPPHSGKDTIADAVADCSEIVVPTFRYALSQPMRAAGFALLDMEYSDEKYEEIKDQPIPALDNIKFRRWMIEFSEKFMKPTYGHMIWARLLWQLIERDTAGLPALVLISDIGFSAEVQYLTKQIPNGHYLNVRLYREGTDWSKDSRNYVAAPQTLVLDNNGTADECVDRILYEAFELNWSL